MNRHLTNNSSIKDIPPSLNTKMCQLLNNDNSWKDLLAEIKKRNSNIPRFKLDDENRFSQLTDPAGNMLREWSSDNVKVSKLLEVLKKIDHLRIIELLEENMTTPTLEPEPPVRLPEPPPVRPPVPSLTPEPPQLPVEQPMEPPVEPPVELPIENIDRFPYQTLGRYTNDFNERPVSEGGNLIGFGGSADVFLGYIRELGRHMAVKRMKNNQTLTNKQFENEVKVLHSLGYHRNLLQFFGISTDGPVTCIVFEYMVGGSLQDRLMLVNREEALSIRDRIAIAEDVAEGLIYLHSKKLVHRDIKSSNILLGDSGEAKLADYGITRPGPSNNHQTQTVQIIGTMVYMPPEYCRDGIVSYKTDSYSFGIVVLELLTSLPAYDPDRGDLHTCLDDHVRNVRINNVLDRSAGIWNTRCVNAVHDLSCRLLKKYKERPLLSDVLAEIQEWKNLI